MEPRRQRRWWCLPAGTTDPDSDGLTYLWNFGDGATITSPNPSHAFNDKALLGQAKIFNVTLRLTEARGASMFRNLLVSGSNKPPQITITQPVNGSYFSAAQFTQPLRATVVDSEHAAGGQYTCSWQVTLYHNTHQHREPLISACSPDVLVDGVSHQCEAFFWGFRLTVADAAGFSDTEEVFIHPKPQDCNDNGVDDVQDLASGTSEDCDHNGVPDECDVASGGDCNGSGVPDACETAITVGHHFDEGVAPFQLNGAATWPSGSEEVRLTTAGNYQQGSMIRPAVTAQPLPFWEAEFEFRVGGGSGADGFSFAALNSADFSRGSNFGEEGPGGGGNSLALCFDAYDNGGWGENVIEVRHNGVSLGTYVPSFGLDDDQVHVAVVRMTARGLSVRVSSTPGVCETAFYDLPVPNYAPATWLFGFGGRTGGLNNVHAISHPRFSRPSALDVDFDGVPDSCQCRADYNGRTGPGGGLSVQDIFDFLAADFAGCA